jgi:hypothetical protein
MKTYEVTIKATIYQAIIVEANNEDEAYEAAHEQFSVLPEPGVCERYEQETIDIEEVENAA